MNRDPIERAVDEGEQRAMIDQFPHIEDYERALIHGPAVAEVNVQWKNVDICADIQCVCSSEAEKFEFHLDGLMGGTFTCPNCGRTYQLPWTQMAFEVAHNPQAVVLDAEDML